MVWIDFSVGATLEPLWNYFMKVFLHLCAISIKVYNVRAHSKCITKIINAKMFPTFFYNAAYTAICCLLVVELLQPHLYRLYNLFAAVDV